MAQKRKIKRKKNGTPAVAPLHQPPTAKFIDVLKVQITGEGIYTTSLEDWNDAKLSGTKMLDFLRDDGVLGPDDNEASFEVLGEARMLRVEFDELPEWN